MLIRADHDSIWNFSVRVLAGAVRHNILIFSVRVIDSQHRPDWRTPPRTKLSSKRLARDRFSQVLISKAVADFESLSVARISNATASETATCWLTVRSRSCKLRIVSFCKEKLRRLS
jgi:hypothetical protein